MKTWGVLQKLCTWERENLPNGGSLESRAVFVWLLKLERSGRPLKELYQQVITSEPTMRKCIRSFAEHGLVVIQGSNFDRRSLLVFATPKLERLAEEYLKQIRLIVSEDTQLGVETNDPNVKMQAVN